MKRKTAASATASMGVSGNRTMLIKKNADNTSSNKNMVREVGGKNEGMKLNILDVVLRVTAC